MTRNLILIAIAMVALPACAQNTTPPPEPRPLGEQAAFSQEVNTFNDAETAEAIADFFGVSAEAAAQTVERIFADHGQPTAYIAGQEGSGAVVLGLRYGEGWLRMKHGDVQQVYWQGPSIGFDVGADGSRVFVLVYDLHNPEFIYRRFPGVAGSAYLIAGMSVNYKHVQGVTLAEIRSGAGLRLGANVGYTAYTRNKRLLPF